MATKPNKCGSRYSKHLLYEKQQDFPLEVNQVPANTPVRAQGKILVPVGIPNSINLMEADEGMALKRQLDLYMEMKKWPDWMHAEPIMVQPWQWIGRRRRGS